jgi:hypothetical protein
VGSAQDWSWLYQLLPFIEQGNVWSNPSDNVVKQAPIKTYFCPSRRNPVVRPLQDGAVNDYVGNGGTVSNATNGVIIPSGGIQVTVGNIPDGTSNTILISEKHLRRTAYNGGAGNDNQGYWRGADSDTLGLAQNPTGNFWQPMQDDLVDRFTGLGSTFGSAHPGAFFAAFSVGSVRSIRYSVNMAGAFQPACQRDDGRAYSHNDL